MLRPRLRPIQCLSPPRLVQCQTTDDINVVMGIILRDKGVQIFFLEQGVRISPFMTQLSQKFCSTEYKLCTFSVLRTARTGMAILGHRKSAEYFVPPHPRFLEQSYAAQ